MRSDRLYLADIVEAADAIAAFIHGVDASISRTTISCVAPYFTSSR
jgi:uncharacterized protein with HEPN domain